ncbi:MAG: L-Ala-D/L-Glu epimerase [Thermoanaerobacteraceae bacterium]|nr:L-Ala-D/L-Glu epimerase [Thermoanaerobacteraceae bacterium]
MISYCFQAGIDRKTVELFMGTINLGSDILKITKIEAATIEVPMKKPFRVAYGTTSVARNIIVYVHGENGLTGIGGTAGPVKVTGDTLASVKYVIDEVLAPAIVGLDSTDIEKITAVMDGIIVKNTAAKAAVDMALYDLTAKSAGLPLYKLLGGYKNTLETDYTLGIDEPEIMAREAMELKDMGFKTLKVKVGEEPGKDIERIKKIRQAIGNDVKIRLDANQGWKPKEAIRIIKTLEEYDIELVEQPVPYWDIDGLAKVTRSVDVPIMADEACHTLQDALMLIKKEAVDLINIKLPKCGGIFKALQIAHIAASAGMECMVGCMVETRASILPAVHLACGVKNITRADLDSAMYLKEDPVIGGATVENAMFNLSDEPGTGVKTVNIYGNNPEVSR